MKRSVWLLLLVITGLLSGCAMKNAEDAMTIPQMKLNQYDLWLNHLKNSNVIYGPAELGDDVFFAVTELPTLTLHVFDDKVQEKRQLVLNANFFHKVKLYDVDGDGKKEVIINYNHEVDGPTVSIYRFDKLLTSLYTTKATSFVIGNLRGVDSLFLIVDENVKEWANKYIVEKSLKDFSDIDKVDVGFMYFANMTFGKLDVQRDAIFYSAGIGAHSGYSDAVVLDEKGKLKTLFYSASDLNEDLYNEFYTVIRDTDGDGIYEFPFYSISPHQIGESSHDITFYTVYKSYHKGTFIETNTLYEMYFGYLKMKPLWIEKWSIEKNEFSEKEIWYAFKDAEKNTTIFTLYYVDDLHRNKLIKKLENAKIVSESMDYSVFVVWGKNVKKVFKEEILRHLTVRLKTGY